MNCDNSNKKKDHLEFKPSIASRVYKDLWVGSAPPIGIHVSDNDFDVLVLCAVEYQLHPSCFPAVNVIHAPLNDNGLKLMTASERKIAIKAAANVMQCLADGRSVLVTCQEGRNRSGLIAALALCIGEPKYTPDQAIAAIRKARGEMALSNSEFVNFLHLFYDHHFKS